MSTITLEFYLSLSPEDERKARELGLLTSEGIVALLEREIARLKSETNSTSPADTSPDEPVKE